MLTLNQGVNMNGGVYMTNKEVKRHEVICLIANKRMSQSEAAGILSLSLRQVQRLYAQYRIHGIKGLVSKKRGSKGNHKLPSITRKRILELVTCELYSGFRPTFMCEKLLEFHGISISKETTRKLMMEAGVWRSHNKKSPAVHQQRKRRARVGELLQIDGSPHAWFEDRGNPCTLIVFIDDATGRTFARFFESETTNAYMLTSTYYINKYGCPLAFYSDKHGIFRDNHPGTIKKESLTQFGRALKELGIELICANSPQAKGRVERVNATLQDRLVKEMRIRGISTIGEANNFLEEFLEEFNAKFPILPENKQDAHIKIGPEINLQRILCHKEIRKVSKNLEIQYKSVIYQIMMEKPSRSLIRAQVVVLESPDGKISIEYKGKSLKFKEFLKQISNGKEISSKEIDSFLRKAKERKVSYRHPWKQQGRAQAKMKEYQYI